MAEGAGPGGLKGQAMRVGDLSPEVMEERLMEARRTYRLNLG